jgi:hypothetical protein
MATETCYYNNGWVWFLFFLFIIFLIIILCMIPWGKGYDRYRRYMVRPTRAGGTVQQEYEVAEV